MTEREELEAQLRADGESEDVIEDVLAGFDSHEAEDEWRKWYAANPD